MAERTVSHVLRVLPRGAATRARIVEAASELMYVRGVAATTLDGIMAASGVSESQLYHHFPDKDALIQEVIDRQSNRLLAWQQERLENLDSLRGLERWRDALVQNNGLRNGADGFRRTQSRSHVALLPSLDWTV